MYFLLLTRKLYFVAKNLYYFNFNCDIIVSYNDLIVNNYFQEDCYDCIS